MARAISRLLIWGAGGHGRVVAEIARLTGHDVIGYVDAKAALRSTFADSAGARVVLHERELLEHLQAARTLPLGADAVAVAIGDNRARHERVVHLGALCAGPLIHPCAVISPSASVAEGSVICALAVVATDASVGRGAIINDGAVIGHDSTVSDGCHVATHATLAGGVRLGERVFVAAGATVLPAVAIGADVVVGAGAVVLHDLPAGVRVVGVPARPIEEVSHELHRSPNPSLAAAAVRR